MSDSTPAVTLENAFDDAWEEASAPVEDAAPATETTAVEEPESPPAELPTEPTEKVEQVATEEDDDLNFTVTKEELEAIKKDPVLSKLYKSMQRGATQKYQQIASQRRILDEYQRDPEGFTRRLAQYHGLQLATPPPPTPAGEAVDEVMQEMEGLFGPEAARALKPVFEKLVGNVLQREITPIKEQQEVMRMVGAAKQAEALTGTFRAKHPDVTPDIEAKMVELGQRFQPADSMDPVEYLESLYLLATAGKVKAETSKQVVERMRKAAESVEPRKSVPASSVPQSTKVKPGMDFDDAFDAAWEESFR